MRNLKMLRFYSLVVVLALFVVLPGQVSAFDIIISGPNGTVTHSVQGLAKTVLSNVYGKALPSRVVLVPVSGTRVYGAAGPNGVFIWDRTTNETKVLPRGTLGEPELRKTIMRSPYRPGLKGWQKWAVYGGGGAAIVGTACYIAVKLIAN